MYQKIYVNQKIWLLENILNQGAFGTIYDTCLAHDLEFDNGEPASGTQNVQEWFERARPKHMEACRKYVIKCGVSCAKQDHIKNERRIYENLISNSNHIKFIPQIYACEPNFILMEKFDLNLEQYLTINRVEKSLLHLFITHILKALEFLHSQNYSHGDIKTSNMLVNFKNPVIKLSDFGLVRSFVDIDGTHISYSPGSNTAHKGTLIFISEDSHRGVVPSRRSDLENLGWVLIHSFFDRYTNDVCTSRGVERSSFRNEYGLPWKKMKGKKQILNEKIKNKALIMSFGVKKIVRSQTTNRLDNYFQYVFRLSYSEQPNYKMMVDIFS